ncbi:rhodanese-like domain-containing protein [Photobacterium sp. SDRW27]|uniref:rhodanese-like domain-containing protein n=1 Tax=Photobacterium obscurum TaxID=2829490 RepID=UPI002244DEF3|nr:rhodanese-like domain-containing protein [Photobacterium obscurum]MCW8327667.1 rhodanese-like domain-containing protein [Photobacterium obscurum]
MFKKAALLLVLFTMPYSSMAEEIIGKIQSISIQGKVIQFINPKTNEVSVLKFTEETKLESADSFKDLMVNTKFKATVDDNMVAGKIKRVLVNLPKDQIIGTDELAELIESGQPLYIGDARPKSKYDTGHIPGAKPSPASELGNNLNWLLEDKATPLVFYCGGVTCPLSPKALKIAKTNGYQNVRAYVDGFPAWKADVYPSHVNQEWLAKNLDIHHVILDVRTAPKSFVKGSVHLPALELVQMHEQWNKEKYPTQKRTIFTLRDKKAPITIVANSDSSDEAIEAYEILTFWKFKNVAILNEGFVGWSEAQLPVESGKIATELNYVKKLATGAIDEKDFVNAVTSGKAMIIDVRSADEASQGRLKNAMNIPLDELERHLDRIPKTGLVVLHCVGGARASLAYTALTKKGYTNVKFLDDTFEDVVKENGITLLDGKSQI